MDIQVLVSYLMDGYLFKKNKLCVREPCEGDLMGHFDGENLHFYWPKI
jgi:hypothetical protein